MLELGEAVCLEGQSVTGGFPLNDALGADADSLGELGLHEAVLCAQLADGGGSWLKGEPFFCFGRSMFFCRGLRQCFLGGGARLGWFYEFWCRNICCSAFKFHAEDVVEIVAGDCAAALVAGCSFNRTEGGIFGGCDDEFVVIDAAQLE